LVLKATFFVKLKNFITLLGLGFKFCIYAIGSLNKLKRTMQSCHPKRRAIPRAPGRKEINKGRQPGQGGNYISLVLPLTDLGPWLQAFTKTSPWK
jgi:hypothetical protein